MRVLFVGGTGEISYACTRRAAEVGHDVTVFNRGQADEPLPDGVQHLLGDVADADSYARLAEGQFDIVCQFLAYQMDIVQRDVKLFGGKVSQYVFISTASAYQKPPSRCLITENTPLSNPFWPYSQQKADMEAYLWQQHEAGRLNVTIVRPSHTVRRRFPGGIVRGDDWAWRLLHQRPVLIHGDGTSIWTLTHSDDFAVPFVKLLGNSAALGEACHITRHMESYTWNQIFTEMAQALDVEADFVHVPTNTLVRYDPQWVGPLWGDKAHSVLFDNTKLMQLVGPFECPTGLPEIMRQAARHYHRRSEYYQPDQQLHASLDRIASDVRSLGPA